ncbi:hypothetical protein Fcan01_24250 [Folsomia candida]|uniref:Uncharacterized protein n=1 Tax=Folsomia candida TaxID=158441 RepID=A0A226D822_FOLCA|nr:hypothetical protein Fcan01_24250 [Folsomia candida]
MTYHMVSLKSKSCRGPHPLGSSRATPTGGLACDDLNIASSGQAVEGFQNSRHFENRSTIGKVIRISTFNVVKHDKIGHQAFQQEMSFILIPLPEGVVFTPKIRSCYHLSLLRKSNDVAYTTPASTFPRKGIGVTPQDMHTALAHVPQVQIVLPLVMDYYLTFPVGANVFRI